MEELFKDPQCQKILDKDGALTRPLLSAGNVKEIFDFYNELHPDGIPPQMRDGIHMTTWCSDPEYKLCIKNKLEGILKRACERLFKDFRIVSPVFIVKRKGADTTFPIHQDWSVVDETRHKAFNIWVPLHNVKAEQGALWVVKGSHCLPLPVRGPGLLFPRLNDIENHVKPLMEPMDMEAGDAMIFYHRIIHGSPPNQCETPRVVVSFSLLPVKVPLTIFFQKDKTSPLQKYEPPDDFIYKYINVRDHTAAIPPSGKLIEERKPLEQFVYTPELFDKLYWGKKKKRLFRRLLGGKNHNS